MTSSTSSTARSGSTSRSSPRPLRTTVADRQFPLQMATEMDVVGQVAAGVVSSLPGEPAACADWRNAGDPLTVPRA